MKNRPREMSLRNILFCLPEMSSPVSAEPCSTKYLSYGAPDAAAEIYDLRPSGQHKARKESKKRLSTELMEGCSGTLNGPNDPKIGSAAAEICLHLLNDVRHA
jgi:hypothetical protein